MDQLTKQDYDALFAVLRKEMPRITRSAFPSALAQLIGDGIVRITITKEEVLATMPGITGAVMHRVTRSHSPQWDRAKRTLLSFLESYGRHSGFDHLR